MKKKTVQIFVFKLYTYLFLREKKIRSERRKKNQTSENIYHFVCFGSDPYEKCHDYIPHTLSFSLYLSLFLCHSIKMYTPANKMNIYIYVYMHKRWNCKYRVGFCYRHLLSFPFQRIYYIWLSLLYFAYSTHLQFKNDLSPSLV